MEAIDKGLVQTSAHSVRQETTEQERGIFGDVSEKTALILGVFITLLVIGLIGFGINVLFTSLS